MILCCLPFISFTSSIFHQTNMSKTLSFPTILLLLLFNSTNTYPPSLILLYHLASNESSNPVQCPHLSAFQTHLISLHFHNLHLDPFHAFNYYLPLNQSEHSSTIFSKNIIRSLPCLKPSNGFPLPFGISQNSLNML